MQLSLNTFEKRRPLQEQTALVTHATTGIGAAIAGALADAGAKVMINYLDEHDQAEQLAEHIRNNQGQVMKFRADLSQENQVKSMLDVLIAYWGRLDILVNNVGLHQNHHPLLNPEPWHKAISLNLARQFLRVRKTTDNLLALQINTPASTGIGKIICVSNPDIYSKASLTKLLAIITKTLATDSIRVEELLVEKTKPYPIKQQPLPAVEFALSSFIADRQDYHADAIAKMLVRLVADD